MSLADFSHHHQAAHPDLQSRITAAAMTAGLYTVFALLAWWSLTHVRPAAQTAEITAYLLSDPPTKRSLEPVPPVIAQMIKPRAEKAALPVFTIASGAPPQAPAPLAASAAKTSPLLGGTSGTGPMGQAASGNGTGGNGAGSAGCIDAVWMRAVSERVRQFFYYPDAALALRTTGVAMVHVSVRRNGQIDRLEIRKSSGNAELDKAAIDILQKAQPLPPIPDRMHAERVDGELPINFGVRRVAGGGSLGTCGN